MDNLTHTLAGVAMSHAGLNRKTRFATLVLVIGSSLPDIDVVSRIDSSATYLKYHRGITHSILGVIVLGFILWGCIYWVGKRVRPKPRLPLNAAWLLCAALLGTASHLLLDFTNSYGVRPFLPFSGRWYAWDIMYIFDPLLLLLLALGLGVPWLLRLVSEEVGARKSNLARGAIFALSVMAALWGVRTFAHNRALSILDSRTYSEQNPQRLDAFPSPGNPLAWTGVVETDAALDVLSVNALNPNQPPVEVRTFKKPEASAALEAAMRTRTGRIFMDFARFPWGEVEAIEDGFLVSLRDLRFYRGMARSRGFVVDVDLDKDLRVRSESFSFNAPLRRGEE